MMPSSVSSTHHRTRPDESMTLSIRNAASVGLASQIVFAFMGIRPRTFIEKRAANQSALIQIAICLILLAIISGVIALEPSFL